jgi:hypothetical protein
VLPATALILAAPSAQPASMPVGRRIRFGTGRSFRVARSTVGQDPPWEEQLYSEVWFRLETGRLWRWQAGVYFRRWLAAGGNASHAHDIKLPAWSLSGEPVPVFAGEYRDHPFDLQLRFPGRDWKSVPMDHEYDSVLFSIDPPAQSGSWRPEFRVRVGPYVVESESQHAVEFRPQLQSLLERVDRPEAGARVLAALRPRVVMLHDGAALQYNNRANEPEWDAIDFGTAFTAELQTADGQVLARAKCFTDAKQQLSMPGVRMVLQAALEPVSGVKRDEIDALGRAELRLVLRGDPAASAEYYLDFFYVLPRAACWSGEVSVAVDRIETGDDLRPVATSPNARPHH